MVTECVLIYSLAVHIFEARIRRESCYRNELLTHKSTVARGNFGAGVMLLT